MEDAGREAASSPVQEWGSLPWYSRKRSAEHLQPPLLFQSFKPPDNVNTRPKPPKLMAPNLGADGMIRGLAYPQLLLSAEWGRSDPDHPMYCTAHTEDHSSGMGLLLLGDKLIRNTLGVPAISLVGPAAFKIEVCEITSIINVLENVNIF